MKPNVELLTSNFERRTESRPLVIGVHGIWSVGKGSTDVLLGRLAGLGYRTMEVDRGSMSAVLSGLKVEAAARELMRQIEGEATVHVIAHSWGAAVVLKAMELGQRFGVVYLFVPAIPADTVFPGEKYLRVVVIANRRDWILTVGKRLLGRLGFGDLGRVGYQGLSFRVKTLWQDPVPRRLIGQHSAAFANQALTRWEWEIHEDLEIVNRQF